MADSFHNNCYFNTNTTQTAISGSVISFKLKEEANIVEATDANDKFIQVDFSRRKKIASFDVLLVGPTSGAAFPLPKPGDTMTITNSWCTEVSGVWGVTSFEISAQAGAHVVATGEACQWITSAGTLPAA